MKMQEDSLHKPWDIAHIRRHHKTDDGSADRRLQCGLFIRQILKIRCFLSQPGSDPLRNPLAVPGSRFPVPEK